MSNERSRDFGGPQSHGFDHGAGRRDPGEEALQELARLISDRGDSVSLEPPKSEPRLSDVSRVVSSQAEAGSDKSRYSFMRSGDRAASSPGRPYDDRRFEHRPAPGRDDPGRDNSGDEFNASASMLAPPVRPGAELPGSGRADDEFNFPALLPDRSDYRAAPRMTAADEPEFVIDNPRRAPQRHEYASHYLDGDDADYGEPEEFDDEDGEKKRRPTGVILAVLGLAVFGSAAAYGYRTFVSSVPSGPTPIIHADNSPTKITPMSDVKQDTGRIGDRAGEQLVRRDEDPVDIGTAPGSGGGSGADANGAASDDAAPAVSPRDPRRVQTVPIRADEGAASAPDRAASRSVMAPSASAVPSPAARQAAAVPPSPPPPPPQAPGMRQAAVTPVEPAAASAPPGAGYVVQIAAVRSEADAQTAFRQVQAKYPLLSGRQPLIRRKDLGERGVFFAAMVGPFNAKSDADQLCVDLKAAGGSCFVQRN